MDSRVDSNPLAIGPAAGVAAAVVIFLHGRDRTPDEMRDLALAIDMPMIRFVMPAAPERSWYPEGFMDPLVRNEPKLTHSLKRCADMIDDLRAGGTPLERVVLGGFSQGACVTAEMLIRHPRRYGGALIFTGGLFGPPGAVWPTQTALRGLPVYLSGSRRDGLVPVSRIEETQRVLTASGADVTTRIFAARGHVVSDDEIAGARRLLAAVTAPEMEGRANAIAPP